MWPWLLRFLGAASMGYVANDAADTAGRVTNTKERTSGLVGVVVALVAVIVLLMYLLFKGKKR